MPSKYFEYECYHIHVNEHEIRANEELAKNTTHDWFAKGDVHRATAGLGNYGKPEDKKPYFKATHLLLLSQALQAQTYQGVRYTKHMFAKNCKCWGNYED